MSFNRAFRAPSFINNHIQTTILNQVDLSRVAPLPSLSPFTFPIGAIGNPDLKQETMTAYEVGYTGVIRKRATVSGGGVYWNNTKDGIYFTPNACYGAAEPAARLAVAAGRCSALLALNNPPVILPSRFTYLNLGKIKDKGIELGVDGAVNRYLNVFTNYSYQWMPVAEDLPAGTCDRATSTGRRRTASTPASISATSRLLGNLSRELTPTPPTGRTCSTCATPA